LGKPLSAYIKVLGKTNMPTHFLQNCFGKKYPEDKFPGNLNGFRSTIATSRDCKSAS